MSSSRLPPHLRAQFSSVAQLPPTLRPPGRLRGCLGKRPPKAEPGEHLETRGDSALPVHLHQQRGHTHTHTYPPREHVRTLHMRAHARAHCTCMHARTLSPHTLYMRAHAHFPLTHTHTHVRTHCTCAHTARARTHTSPSHTHVHAHTHTPPTPAPTALSLVMKPGRCCLWSLIRSADRPAQQSGATLSTCGVSFLSAGPG